MFHRRHVRPTCWLSLATIFLVSSAAGDEVSFNRDILPILSNNCFQCHGPDEANREAGLRLDKQESATGELDSGQVAVVPKQLDASELYLRITTTDEDLRMPPVDSGKTLTAQQQRLVAEWIEQGATWAQHWAFEAPIAVPVPASIDHWRPVNEVDRFLHQRIQAADLAPEPEASRESLIRRATLDLTGLPPTIEEIDAFLADTEPGAYSRLLDRLLNKNTYGEHMARSWLDAARYADTHGLHLDNERSIWPYREWVINAFNQNMPFDEFTVQQLAGDLLPEPTLQQVVATGFNRCNVTTSEGGSIDDEYYVRYAVDRVETTSTVWLGLTAGCAACHDHKFDPLTQKEFYQLFSYFFSLTEKAMDGNALLPPPTVKVPTAEQAARKRHLEDSLHAVKLKVEQAYNRLQYYDSMATSELTPLPRDETTWLDDETPTGAELAGDGESPWQFVNNLEAPVFSGAKASKRSAQGLSQHFFTKAETPLVAGAHDFLFAHVYLDPSDPPETIQLQFHDGNWEHRAYWGANKGHAANKKGPANHHMGKLPATGKWVRLEVPAGAIGLPEGSKIDGLSFTQFGGTVYWDRAGLVTVRPPSAMEMESLALWEQFRQQIRYPALPDAVQEILDTPIADRSDQQTARLRRHYLQQANPTTKSQFSKPLEQADKLARELADLENTIPGTLVMKEREQPRQAYVLERGQYTEQREPVDSRVPEWILPSLPEAPENRMGLAQWLVAPDHPLTSRVTVNRIWQHFFGTGIVKTSEDFGVQGERPSHPELLDWLAVHFVDSGWNVKALQKMLMMSATYRQSSRVLPDKLAVDPENRLLARGPRYRLDAEVIRDQALAVGGLLVRDIGGKSVRPYQPAGLWKPVGFGGSNTSVFKQDAGDKLYRRSMYTFWKRTSPPPSMATFDAPDRETCQVRRARTNTPLQALVLMNDVQFVEAARKFAERVLREGGDHVSAQLTFAFRTATSRQPTDAELVRLSSVLKEYREAFTVDTEAASRLLSAGESPRDESLDLSELGAWTMVTHLLLNLNETITKG